MIPEKRLPEFTRLLVDASSCSELVDKFDLRDDAVSKASFERLQREQTAAFSKLVTLCGELSAPHWKLGVPPTVGWYWLTESGKPEVEVGYWNPSIGKFVRGNGDQIEWPKFGMHAGPVVTPR